MKKINRKRKKKWEGVNRKKKRKGNNNMMLMDGRIREHGWTDGWKQE